MKKVITVSLLVICFALLATSCSKDEIITTNPTSTIEIKKKEFVENYVNIVLASYEDTLNKLYDLQS